jgi:hypothetical protein
VEQKPGAVAELVSDRFGEEQELTGAKQRLLDQKMWVNKSPVGPEGTCWAHERHFQWNPNLIS